MQDQRYIDIEALKERMKKDDYSWLGNIPMHCQICGDTNPKHGFYPLWGMAIGEGIYQTSGFKCNKCGCSDENYLKNFGETKDKDL